jgi:SAM-dependent methyltransferase
MQQVMVGARQGRSARQAICEAAMAAILLTGLMGAAPGLAARNEDPDPFTGDVPYVPTPQDVVDTMLTIAQVGASDYVIDLGSGDGRIVVTAASKFGAQGFGVDLNPRRIAEALDNAKAAGVSDRAQFFQRNLFDTDFSKATVLTMYLLPDVNLQLRPKVLALKPGTRIVSHDFDMADWKPDHSITMRSAQTGYNDRIYFWVVPAKAAGQWRWSAGGENPVLTIEQKFQAIKPSLAGVKGWQAAEGALKGDQILITAKDDAGRTRIYSGRVIGDVIEGVAKGPDGESRWQASRVPAAVNQ